MTKMTYTQAIDNALEIIYTALATDPTMWENMDVTAEKLTALKEQLAKRSNGDRKPTKSQAEKYTEKCVTYFKTVEG